MDHHVVISGFDAHELSHGHWRERIAQPEFIARFRLSTRMRRDSPMPWAAYARMSDAELGAIYRYLRTLKPAKALD
jgi:mono/diheme cytochrome c family protein